MNLRIVSWNILQGGGKRAAEIAQTLIEFSPDILVLQEYRNGKNSTLIQNTLDHLELTQRNVVNSSARKNAVLVASRFTQTTDTWHDDLDPTLAVHASIETGAIPVELFAGHLPHKRAQQAYFNYLLNNRALREQATLLIGDLNCGIPFEDSDTKTFANTHQFQALLKRGWTDSWRSRHPTTREFTWVSPRNNGYRYDHCLSSASFDSQITRIHYDHSVRETGLSDHSALIVECNLSA